MSNVTPTRPSVPQASSLPTSFYQTNGPAGPNATPSLKFVTEGPPPPAATRVAKKDAVSDSGATVSIEPTIGVGSFIPIDAARPVLDKFLSENPLYKAFYRDKSDPQDKKRDRGGNLQTATYLIKDHQGNYSLSESLKSTQIVGAITLAEGTRLTNSPMGPAFLAGLRKAGLGGVANYYEKRADRSFVTKGNLKERMMEWTRVQAVFNPASNNSKAGFALSFRAPTAELFKTKNPALANTYVGLTVRNPIGGTDLSAADAHTSGSALSLNFFWTPNRSKLVEPVAIATIPVRFVKSKTGEALIELPDGRYIKLPQTAANGLTHFTDLAGAPAGRAIDAPDPSKVISFDAYTQHLKEEADKLDKSNPVLHQMTQAAKSLANIDPSQVQAVGQRLSTMFPEESLQVTNAARQATQTVVGKVASPFVRAGSALKDLAKNGVSAAKGRFAQVTETWGNALDTRLANELERGGLQTARALTPAEAQAGSRLAGEFGESIAQREAAELTKQFARFQKQEGGDLASQFSRYVKQHPATGGGAGLSEAEQEALRFLDEGKELAPNRLASGRTSPLRPSGAPGSGSLPLTETSGATATLERETVEAAARSAPQTLTTTSAQSLRVAENTAQAATRTRTRPLTLSRSATQGTQEGTQMLRRISRQGAEVAERQAAIRASNRASAVEGGVQRAFARSLGNGSGATAGGGATGGGGGSGIGTRALGSGGERAGQNVPTTRPATLNRSSIQNTQGEKNLLRRVSTKGAEAAERQTVARTAAQRVHLERVFNQSTGNVPTAASAAPSSATTAPAISAEQKVAGSATTHLRNGIGEVVKADQKEAWTGVAKLRNGIGETAGKVFSPLAGKAGEFAATHPQTVARLAQVGEGAKTFLHVGGKLVSVAGWTQTALDTSYLGYEAYNLNQDQKLRDGLNDRLISQKNSPRQISNILLSDFRPTSAIRGNIDEDTANIRNKIEDKIRSGKMTPQQAHTELAGILDKTPVQLGVSRQKANELKLVAASLLGRTEDIDIYKKQVYANGGVAPYIHKQASSILAAQNGAYRQQKAREGSAYYGQAGTQVSGNTRIVDQAAINRITAKGSNGTSALGTVVFARTKTGDIRYLLKASNGKTYELKNNGNIIRNHYEAQKLATNLLNNGGVTPAKASVKTSPKQAKAAPKSSSQPYYIASNPAPAPTKPAAPKVSATPAYKPKYGVQGR